MVRMIEKIIDFLSQGIWRIRLRGLPRRKYYLFRTLRVVVLSLRNFDRNKCQLRASALTFYTLLSVVPVMAMAFGVAKGFGLRDGLDNALKTNIKGQEEAIGYITEWSDNLLANTGGGIIAGVGVLLLLWSVIRLLGSIERSFNEIFGIQTHRSLGRRVIDYMAFMLIAPIFLVISSSLTVFLIGQIDSVMQSFQLIPVSVGATIKYFARWLPYLVIWGLFMFIYLYMPNTRVHWRAALLGGVIGGTMFQLLQWGYVWAQFGVARYNAIYASFAALPLFLMWVQASWLIVLFGAEICFAFENEETYEFERDCLNVSRRFKQLMALRIIQLSVGDFVEARRARNAVEIANHIEAPIRLVREVLGDLVRADVMSAISREGSNGKSSECYQPAQSVDRLTIKRVLELLDTHGTDSAEIVKPGELDALSERLQSLDKLTDASSANLPIRDL